MYWYYRNETTKWEWWLDPSRKSFKPAIEHYFRGGREIIVISEDEFITVRSDGWVIHKKRM